MRFEDSHFEGQVGEVSVRVRGGGGRGKEEGTRGLEEDDE